MRISDWSSDVCSSDLPPPLGAVAAPPGGERASEAELGRHQKIDASVRARRPDRLAFEHAAIPIAIDDRIERGKGPARAFGRGADECQRRERSRAAEQQPIGRGSWRARVGQYV